MDPLLSRRGRALKVKYENKIAYYTISTYGITLKDIFTECREIFGFAAHAHSIEFRFWIDDEEYAPGTLIDSSYNGKTLKIEHRVKPKYVPMSATNSVYIEDKLTSGILFSEKATTEERLIGYLNNAAQMIDCLIVERKLKAEPLSVLQLARKELNWITHYAKYLEAIKETKTDELPQKNVD